MAKIIAHGADRAEALARLRKAIAETHIEGIKTNLVFHAEVLADLEFQAGGMDTGFLPRFFGRKAALLDA